MARTADQQPLQLGALPNANVIRSVAGLVIFGGYTILDFNRLRRAGEESAVPIAASIFLDVAERVLVLPAAIRWRARLGRFGR